MFWNKKSDKTNSNRASEKPNQRVYTYYTASKGQIDSFERSTKKRNTSKFSFSLGKLALFIGSVVVVFVLVFIHKMRKNQN